MGDFVKNPPDASALMNAARSFGNYDLASALSDLIDNSITAGASHIVITCRWNAGIPEIRIRDNGQGMSKERLHVAMRPASDNPVNERHKDDLGRFGLGLKTASLSQAKCLTVISYDGDELKGARWDLDHIQNWSMEVFSESECLDLLEGTKPDAPMTEVIWTKLDRLTEGGTLDEDLFSSLINNAKNEIALIFHRYLDAGRGNKDLRITLNGIDLPAYDPFKSDHPACQQLETETLEVEGGKIIITPFILPHYSKLNSQEFDALAGEEGYLRNQGFYVYRNRRLIIHGTWFRLVRHGDLSKLARVRIDIPNTLDAIWKITVDKSDAQIPSVLKNRLKSLIERIRDTSVRVYRGRGARIVANDTVSVWTRIIERGGINYEINKEHPLIRQLMSGVPADKKAILQDALALIAKNLPFDTVHADMSDRPTEVVQSYTEPTPLLMMATGLAQRFIEDGGTQNDLLNLINRTEPFRQSADLIREHLLAKGVISD